MLEVTKEIVKEASSKNQTNMKVRSKEKERKKDRNKQKTKRKKQRTKERMKEETKKTQTKHLHLTPPLSPIAACKPFLNDLNIPLKELGSCFLCESSFCVYITKRGSFLFPRPICLILQAKSNSHIPVSIRFGGLLPKFC